MSDATRTARPPRAWRLQRCTAGTADWPNLTFLDEGFDTPIWGEPTFTDLLRHVRGQYSRYEISAVTTLRGPVGLYGFLPFPDEHERAIETLMYLHPDARGAGIARELVLASATAASEAGVDLFADVRTSNERSMRFHQATLLEVPSSVHDSPFGYRTRRWLLTGAEGDGCSIPVVAAMIRDLDRALRASP